MADLIRQLYSDGHITAEEASHLESRKLFKVPMASTNTPSISPAVCDYSIINGNSSNSGISVICTTKVDATKYTEPHNGPTDYVEVTSTDLLTDAFGVTVTEHNSMATNDASVITNAVPEQNIDMTSHTQDQELPPQSDELPADAKLSDKLYSDNLGKTESSDTSELSSIIVNKEQDHQDEKSSDNFPTSTEQTKDAVISTDQTDAPNVDENASECFTSVARVSKESHEEITESDLTVNGHVKSNSLIVSDHQKDTVNGMHVCVCVCVHACA